MKNLFTSIKLQRPKTNNFDLSHDVKMSGNMGQLIPCCVVPTIPGDKFEIGSDVFLRFAPMIAPVMHRIDVTVHYFFCPNRLVWDNWQDFITNQPTGGIPRIQVNEGLSAAEKKHLDYFGIPPIPNGNPVQHLVNALPLAAYQCIYNEYYRDQNLIPEVNYKLNDGINAQQPFTLGRKRAWEHDYFTSCLPFAQKGAAVDIPLGDVELKTGLTNESPYFQDAAGAISGGAVGNTALPTPPGGGTIDVGGNPGQIYNPDGTLQVKPTTINELRRAFRLQEWLERNARGGTRYIENILNHFGVKSSDARLQRPEYITGVKNPVVVSEVLNMTGESGGLPQGNMAGHGVSVGTGYTGKYYCEEHGYIIGVMSVMPKTAYQQGLPKDWSKTDPLDFFWPSFAHIGEQEVLVKELYMEDATTADDVFGYIPRYAEYKYMPNRVAGDFRSTLNYWHLGRIFANSPVLNDEFIECDSDTTGDRIFAVTDPGEDKLYIHILNKIQARRPMPVFGTPML